MAQSEIDQIISAIYAAEACRDRGKVNPAAFLEHQGEYMRVLNRQREETRRFVHQDKGG